MLAATTLVLGQSDAGQMRNSTPIAASIPSEVPLLVPFAGSALGTNGKPLEGKVSLTFVIFTDRQGGEPLWAETQTVLVDAAGKYSTQLGAAQAGGLPASVFGRGDARWLEVQIAGQPVQPRVLLASVPYAMKAASADKLGGRNAEEYVTQEQMASQLQAQLAATASALANQSPRLLPQVTTAPTGSGSAGYLPVWTSTSNLGSSFVYQRGTAASPQVGIGTAIPASALDVNGGLTTRGNLVLEPSTVATASSAVNSPPFSFFASAYNSTTAAAVAQKFNWQIVVSGNNTAAPSSSLVLNSSTGTNGPVPTGFSFSPKGILTFAPGQTFPGTGPGTITGVTAGTGLTGGGTSGPVTLNLDLTKIPQLAASNNFTGTQTITNGILNLSPTTGSQIGAVYIGGIPFLHGYSSGNKNVFVGGAGNFATTAQFTAALGYQALFSLSSGTGNTAVGDVALYANSSGSNNTAVGNSALFGNVSGTMNTAIGASSGPAFGSSALTNSTAVGAGATVTQSNTLVLGQTSSSPGTSFVNVGVGTSAPQSIFEVNQSARGALGPVITLTNPAGQANAAAAIDFNTSTPGRGAGYVPNAEIRALDAGGYTDNLEFYSNIPGAINQGFQRNLEIAANGQVVVGTDEPVSTAQLVVFQEGNHINAIQAYGGTDQASGSAGSGGVAFSGTGGDSTGTNAAGDGGVFVGGNNFENGLAGNGISATTGTGGATPGLGLAGFFSGDVLVTGNLSQNGESAFPAAGIHIDHPLDPANKYLNLSSMQSPERLNVYSGNVTTDELGVAVVTLPEWFEAENADFRYQLTVIGGRFAQAIVSKEIENHTFTISTNATHVKVSWQVTAVRQDAYAKAHPMVTEETKPEKERGFYLNPELYGQPAERQTEWGRRPERMQRLRQLQVEAAARHRAAVAKATSGATSK